MKKKTIPIAIKGPSENLHSEFKMQQADNNKKCKKSKSLTLPMISMCLSLMIIIIPIIWFVFIYMTGDDKTLTSSEYSDFGKIKPQRYGLSPDYSRSLDRYGYHVNSVKIPEYRDFGISKRFQRKWNETANSGWFQTRENGVYNGEQKVSFFEFS